MAELSGSNSEPYTTDYWMQDEHTWECEEQMEAHEDKDNIVVINNNIVVIIGVGQQVIYCYCLK